MLNTSIPLIFLSYDRYMGVSDEMLGFGSLSFFSKSGCASRP